MNRFLKRLNDYALFLLVFSVTFEFWDPFKLVGSISVTYMASVLYIISWIPLAKQNLNFTPLKKYIVPLFIFTIIAVFSTALNTGYAEGFKDLYDGRILMLIILMLLIANHLYNDRSLIQKVLNIYISSIVVMYFLAIVGIGSKYVGGRLLLFGENPNQIGIKAVIAFLIVAAKIIDNKFSIQKLLINGLIAIPLLNLVILSASRGAFISVFLGLAIMIMYLKINVLKKTLIILSGLLCSIAFFNYALQTNEAFKKRIESTIETGDTGRNELWITATEIIGDNLFFGVGFSGAIPVMFKYNGRNADPHNVFLYVLMITGVFGFIFYITFILRLAKNLYANFRLTGRVVYLVIFIVVLFNMSKAGGAIGKIFFWFFFAILIGSTFKSKYIVNNSVDTTENNVA